MRADAVVRISGDSPFMDGSLVTDLVTLYRQNQPDVASNVVVHMPFIVNLGFAGFV